MKSPRSTTVIILQRYVGRRRVAGFAKGQQGEERNDRRPHDHKRRADFILSAIHQLGRNQMG